MPNRNTKKPKRICQDKNSSWELAQIQALNADLARTDYSKISTAPSVLATVVSSAMQGRNRFQLCHEVAGLARKMHVPAYFCFTETITTAMRMLARPVPKGTLRIVKRGVAA